MGLVEIYWRMLSSCFVFLVTDPFQGGIVAYLSTTFLLFVATPGMVGILFSIVGKTPRILQFDYLIGFWFKWFVAWPLRKIFQGLIWLLRQAGQGLLWLCRWGIEAIRRAYRGGP